MGLKLRHFIYIFVLAGVLFRGEGYAAINVSFGSGPGQFNPGTSYYSADYYEEGTSYTFVFDVTNGDIPDWSAITSIKLILLTDLPTASQIVIEIANPGGPVSGSATTLIGALSAGSANYTISTTTDQTDFTVSITYTPGTNIVNTHAVSRSIAVSVEGTGFTTDTGLFPHTYGILKDGITNVTLTMPTPDTTGGITSVDGEYYYLAGKSYTFNVRVQAAAHNWNCINNVTLTIPRTGGGASGSDLVFSINPNGSNGTTTDSASGVSISYTYLTTNSYDFTLRFTLTLSPVTGGNPNLDCLPGPLRQVEASATSALTSVTKVFPTTSATNSYGIATTGIKSVNITTIPLGDPRGTSPQYYYYLAGNSYNFRVTVTANAHSWNCISNVTLTIPGSYRTIVLTATNLGATNPLVSVNNSDPAINGENDDLKGLSVSCSVVSGSPANFVLQFTLNIAEVYPGGSNIDTYPSTSRRFMASALSALFTGVVEHPPDSASFPIYNTSKTYGIATTGIKSITLTMPAPELPTGTSGGRTQIAGGEYYLAGKTYNFTVVVRANGHPESSPPMWDLISNVTLTIPRSGPPGNDLVFIINNPNGTTTGSPVSDFYSSGASLAYSYAGTSTYEVFTLNCVLNIPASLAGNSLLDCALNTRTIKASATSKLIKGTSGPDEVRDTGTTGQGEYAIATAGIKTLVLSVPTAGTAGGISIIDGAPNYYYRAGTAYTFTVTGTANGHNWSCLRDVKFGIPIKNSVSSIEFFIPNASLPAGTENSTGKTINNFPATLTQSNNTIVFSPWTSSGDFTITFTYTPTSNSTDINSDIDSLLAARTIQASVDSVLFPVVGGKIATNTSSGPGTVAPPTTYGIVARGITVRNILIDGNATLPANFFFLPGQSYVFTVNVETIGHSWNCINNITLDIPMPISRSGVETARNIRISFNSLTAGVITPTYTDFVSTLPPPPIIIKAPPGGVTNASVIATAPDPLSPNKFSISFTYTHSWLEDIGPVSPAPRRVQYTTTFLTMSPLTDPYPLSPYFSRTYGVCSSARIAFSGAISPGTVSDGYANPWDNSFSITGSIVYYMTGTSSDPPLPAASLGSSPAPKIIYSFNDTNHSADQFYYSATTSAPTMTGNTLTFNFDPEWFSRYGYRYPFPIVDNGIGRYSWGIELMIDGGLIRCIPPTPLTITCDKIEIFDMEFSGGGGLNPAVTPARPFYMRSVYVPGTKVRVRTRLQYATSLLPVGSYAYPPTTSTGTVTLKYNYGSGEVETKISFTSIGTDGWTPQAQMGEIINPVSNPIPDVTPGTTKLIGAWTGLLSPPGSYRVTSIVGTGRYFNGSASGVDGTGQDDPVKIPQPITSTNAVILWDNGDPPGTNAIGAPIGAAAMFTPWTSTIRGRGRITLNWTALSTVLPALDRNEDFETYRIYYKPTTAPVWSVIDKDTNPPGTTALGVRSTATYTIENLQAMYSYDYYLTALDIFGNETLLANRAFAPSDKVGTNPYGTTTTTASECSVKISDGMTTYYEDDFGGIPLGTATTIGSLNPADRPLLPSAIKVDIHLVGAAQPNELNIILADFNTSPMVYHTTTGALITAAYPADPAPFKRIKALKVSANRWQGFIESAFLIPGQSYKFILEAVRNNAPTYMDCDSPYDEITPSNPNPNPNNYPWTFIISNLPKPEFKPWPTRVLNNVITDKDPVAYPTYYLTEDSNVTITAYDIKGRVVAVLLDNAPRPAGQNIKENGWRGTNRSGKKLGVGLYYVRIKAVGQKSGKVIIDKYSKVVMAR